MPINEYLVGWVAVAEADHHQPFPQQFHLLRWQIGGRDDNERQKDVEKDERQLEVDVALLLRDQLVNQQVDVGGGAGNGGDEDEKSRVRENRLQLARRLVQKLKQVADLHQVIIVFFFFGTERNHLNYISHRTSRRRRREERRQCGGPRCGRRRRGR